MLEITQPQESLTDLDSSREILQVTKSYFLGKWMNHGVTGPEEKQGWGWEGGEQNKMQTH